MTEVNSARRGINCRHIFTTRLIRTLKKENAVPFARHLSVAEYNFTRRLGVQDRATRLAQVSIHVGNTDSTG